MTSILLETGEPSPVQVSSESSETPTRRYATLLAAVRTRGWDAAGMGDDDLRLEEFVLCRDGRYHRRDAFGYKVPECTLQLVRPAATRSESPAGDTEAAEAAEAATAKAKARAKAAVRMVVPRGAGASIHQMDDEQLNDKVRHCAARRRNLVELLVVHLMDSSDVSDGLIELRNPRR